MFTFLAEAEEELYDAVAYYEKQRAGLGKAFFEATYSAINLASSL